MNELIFKEFEVSCIKCSKQKGLSYFMYKLFIFLSWVSFKTKQPVLFIGQCKESLTEILTVLLKLVIS